MNRILFLSSLALATAARADVKYTETTTTSGMPMRLTTYRKAGAERTEQSMKIGAATMNNISVSSCPDKKTYRLDPALKIYTSSLIGGASGAADAKPAAKDNKPAAKTSGKMTITGNAKFLGVEEVAGRKARHYSIDQRIQSEGCAGNTDMTMKMEVWTADYEMPVFACRAGWQAAQPVPSSAGGCAMTTEFKGDQKALNEAYRGLVVKRKTSFGETTMVSEITEFSEAKLDDALFQIPAGWTLVSDEEFDKRRQAAMMKAMTGSAPSPANNDDAPEEGGTMGDVEVDETDAEEKPAEKPKEEEKPKKKKWKLPF
ncbi:MAG TPA: hypothetical protein VF681_02725 [Abditibacteriaceae bacterium]|jgi:hypothetical protein